jgi:hypothetical protein
MMRIVLTVVRPPIGAGRAVGRARLRQALGPSRLDVNHRRVLSFHEMVQQDCVERSAQCQTEQEDCQCKRT